MFTWLDLVAPIGTSFVAMLLCAIGAISSDRWSAKIVCALTFIVFAAQIPAFYVVRGLKTRIDYTTVHGLDVHQGKINRCDKVDIESSTEKLIDFWASYAIDGKSERYPREKIASAFNGTRLICLDEREINVFDRIVGGYSTGRTIAIGWDGNVDHARKLFYHEASHSVLLAVGLPYDEAFHHSVFERAGLRQLE